jgi:hypothetical protein
MTYEQLLERKRHFGEDVGFDPTFMPDFLFPFQRMLVEWAVRKGRAAIFADCGLGKTPMQLVWAQNMVRKTGKPTLILTPLAVGPQTVEEAHKFGIEAAQSRDGRIASQITVTNYHQLHKFDSSAFGAVVCDESSILKNFDGAMRREITDSMRQVKYRLLCTATAAPNDYIELGTSSEALGYMRRVEMMVQYFNHDGGETSRWRLKKHASKHIFWQWVCSWARALRHPHDLGFDDNGFQIPPLTCKEHVVQATVCNPEFLFNMPAIGLDEQRAERRRTLHERCEKVASLIPIDQPSVAWCHLNDEGHLLEKLIPGAVEVDGNDDDDFKEEALTGFSRGQIRVIISKPQIAGFGMNWQHCSHQTFFPSHSFEQWYQAIRRCWRFGQKKPVHVDIIASEGERGVLKNLTGKAEAASHMFSKLVELMGCELEKTKTAAKITQINPLWL